METPKAWTCSTLHKNSVVKAATAKDAALLFMFDQLHHMVLPQTVLVEGNGVSKRFIVTSLIGEALADDVARRDHRVDGGGA